MSSLFNQTNIAPGTAFASGGSSSNIPILNTNTILGATYPQNLIDFSDPALLKFGANATSNSAFIFGVDGSLNLPRIKMDPYGLITLGFYGTTTGADWAYGNNDVGSYAVSFAAISSIGANASAQRINLNALVSTLAVAYPGCVG